MDNGTFKFDQQLWQLAWPPVVTEVITANAKKTLSFKNNQFTEILRSDSDGSFRATLLLNSVPSKERPICIRLNNDLGWSFKKQVEENELNVSLIIVIEIKNSLVC